MKTGIELIADERARQIEKENFDSKHDAQHTNGELTEAALCYAVVGSAQIRGSDVKEWPVDMLNGFNDSLVEWPFEEESYKPSEYALINLVKAGALIAAEIDRLKKAAASQPTK